MMFSRVDEAVAFRVLACQGQKQLLRQGRGKMIVNNLGMVVGTLPKGAGCGEWVAGGGSKHSGEVQAGECQLTEIHGSLGNGNLFKISGL
jgi:hypothetical protein